MKKTLIALAVAGLSFNAAAVDLKNNLGQTIIAKEAVIKFLPANDADAIAASADNLLVKVKTKIGVDRSYIRLQLSDNAEFADAASITADKGYVFSAVAGDKKSVVLSTSEPIAQDDEVTITLAGLKVKDKNPVTVTYTQHESPQDANNSAKPLDTQRGTLLKFENAVSVKVEDKTTKDSLIDVTKKEEKFAGVKGAGALTTDLFELSFIKHPDALGANGSAFTDLTDVLADATVVVDGDFSFAAVNGVTATASSALATPATVTDESATFDLVPTSLTTASTVSLKVAADTVINPGFYTVSVKQAATNTDYSLDSVKTTFENVVELKKNGAQADIDLALSPNSSFQHYVRVTNTADKDGKVYFNLFNDAGEKATVELAELGQNAELAVNNSTQPVSVKELYALASQKNAAFIEGYYGMLRIEVNGEFKADDTADGGIDVQSYSVATDANSFNVFN